MDIPTQDPSKEPKIAFGIQRRFGPWTSRAPFTEALSGSEIPLPYFTPDPRWRIARDPEPKYENTLEAIRHSLTQF